MKNILLLFTEDKSETHKAQPDVLAQHLNAVGEKTDCHYDVAFYQQLMHVIDGSNSYIVDTNSGKRLEDYDFVYHRRWGAVPEQAVSVSIYLHKLGIPFADAEAYRPGAMDKLGQHWRLWEHDLPVPRTAYVPAGKVTAWVDQELTKMFAFPVVIKSINGTRGEDNYLAHDLEEARAILHDNPEVSFLIQEFIPNDGDYRVFVTGEDIKLLIYRQAVEGSHKNNTSQGGDASLKDPRSLQPAVRQACVDAAKAFKRDIAGVDLVFDKRDPNRFYFFEVNRAPQVEASTYGDEKAAALNDYFLAEIAKEEEE